MTKVGLALRCLVFFILGCNCKSAVDKQLVYSTINAIILYDTIHADHICNRFDQIKIPSDIQQQFFPGDMEFIEQQIKNSNMATVDSGRLYFYWKRKRVLEKSTIDTNCSEGFIYHFTYP